MQNLRSWKLKEINPQGWYIMASVSFSFWSYGENISIQVTEPEPGRPAVNALSSSLFAIFDFGKNRRNIEKLFAELQNVLAQAGCVQPQAAAAGQAAPGAVGQPQAGSFCTSCGAPLREGSRFCNNCGQAVPG